MKHNQAENVLLHPAENHPETLFTELFHEFRVRTIERILKNSGLDTKQQIAVIDRLLDLRYYK